MHARIRTACAALVVLGLAAGPLAGTASASPAKTATVLRDSAGPNVKALRAALAGLPDDDATAALVRVGGRDGSWRGSAGVHDLVSGRAALEHGRFRAGSTTKVVTAAVVLQLAAEGKVDLNGHVQTYLPGLLSAAFKKPITVRQLLTFTSGLQVGSTLGDVNGEGYENRYKTLTPEEVVAASVAKGPAPHAPGERQQYSNIDYTVLGMLIERITGDSYEHQAAVRIFRPLGMRHTSFPGGPDPRIHGPHNRGYQRLADGRLVDATEWNMSDRWAAGDMISTTADLERLLVGLFRGKVVPRPLLRKEMLTLPKVKEGVATMSAGLQYYEKNGVVLWLKTGARPGYSTVIATTPDLSRTLVYSINATDAKSEDMNPVADRVLRATFLT
ncbi:serine hydrolase domain-containing protein [Streptomyces sporangiiformans]|uniref:Beta-lactamase family protein n=1 Tax=Streptomyces sporangiiformans TaxID=2315329 RepID=A0A505DAJ5_9ACTN|nr:serine hydrolase domain-containing protein [Streptomyces sporangiiformans]TPQ19827.1 beta-lactamase family protein [Streptomyces sporangiiformans]